MPINRRSFLHAAGLGAAATALAGCGGTQTTSPAPRLPPVAAHAPIDLPGLARKLSGGASPPTCTVLGCYVGSADALDPLLTDLIGRIGSRPTLHTVAQHDYLDAMRYFAGGGHWNREAFVARRG